MSDRRVEYQPLGEIRAAPRNPKRHDTAGIRASVAAFGFAELPLIDERTGRLVAGHGRVDDLATARAAGEPPPDGVRADDTTGEWLVPVVRGWASADDAHAEAYLLASNKLTSKGGWDDTTLAESLAAIDEVGLLDVTGFTDAELSALLDTGDDTGGGGPGGHTDPDDIPDTPKRARTRPGDLWLLGPHRLLCGDSTSPDDVRLVVDGQDITLIHADPPYGMGKESDGVANDNLYGPKLDAFQMAWWKAWLPALTANGSAYIWGNAPDLWRLWWTGGLGTDPDLMVRNEIVWDKKNCPGMRSAGEHSYPTATERCLLIFRGQQFLGNQNKDDYWEGYEPLRSWLCAERDRVGWTNRDINQLTGTNMAGHWFTRSQFTPIPARHYRTLADAAGGRAFTRPYDELFAEMFPDAKGGGNEHRRSLSAQLRADRTHFDNTHDAMTDVWDFPRVVGEDRHGHATPKPVAMVERAYRTSAPPGTVVAAPFGGTGPEFIAAHRTGLVCVGIELEPTWVDVICRRYQEHTGTLPILANTGEQVDFTDIDD